MVEDASAPWKSSLMIWWESIEHLPKSAWTLRDMCRAIGQKFDLDELMPTAIDLLKDDVFLGAGDDQWLMPSLNCLSWDYWITHPEEADAVLEIIDSKLAGKQWPDDFQGCRTASADGLVEPSEFDFELIASPAKSLRERLLEIRRQRKEGFL